MGSYENIVKIEEIRRKIDENDFLTAQKILDTMVVKKIKNVADLNLLAEVYYENEHYDEAAELLLKIYEKMKTRKVLSQLIDISIKRGNMEDAEYFLLQFQNSAPNDFYNYVYRFRIDKLKGESYEKQIETLKELKKIEYIEQWAYELAKLYYKAGMEEECISECSDIVLWFGEGTYVEKAKMLRSYYLGETNKDKILEELKRRAEEMQGIDAQDSSQGIVSEEYEVSGTNIGPGEYEVSEEDDESGEYKGSKVHEGREEDEVSGTNEGYEEYEVSGTNIGPGEYEVSDEDDESGEYKGSKVHEGREDYEVSGTNVGPREYEISEGHDEPDEYTGFKANEGFEGYEVSGTNVGPGEYEASEGYDRPGEYEASEGYDRPGEYAGFEEYEEWEAQEEMPDPKEEFYRESDYISGQDGNSLEDGLRKGVEEILVNEQESDTPQAEEPNIIYQPLQEDTDELDHGLRELEEEYGIHIDAIFGDFLHVQAVKKQLVKCLEGLVRDQKQTRMMVITGTTGTGKTTLAKDMALFLYSTGKLNSSKIAKIKADKLNTVDLKAKKDTLKDCCLVIENASELKRGTIDKLMELSGLLHEELAIIFEEDKKNLNRLFRVYPKLMDLLKNRIHLPQYTEEDLLLFAYACFKQQDYSLNQKAERLLKNRVKQISSASPAKQLEQINSLTRTAMDSADLRAGKQLSDLASRGLLKNVEILTVLPEDFKD